MTLCVFATQTVGLTNEISGVSVTSWTVRPECIRSAIIRCIAIGSWVDCGAPNGAIIWMRQCCASIATKSKPDTPRIHSFWRSICAPETCSSIRMIQRDCSQIQMRKLFELIAQVIFVAMSFCLMRMEPSIQSSLVKCTGASSSRSQAYSDLRECAEPSRCQLCSRSQSWCRTCSSLRSPRLRSGAD